MVKTVLHILTFVKESIPFGFRSPIRKKSLDPRRVKWLNQRLTRGWDDRDTWALDGIIAKFALPRLRRFKELNNGYPTTLTMEKWEEIIDDIIYALEICEYELETSITDCDWDRVDRGLDYFGKHFRDLWW